MTSTNAKTKSEKGNSTKGELFIKSIKISNNLAKICYSESNDTAAVESIYEGKEEITDEFYKIFQDNVKAVTAICPIFSKDISNLQMNVIRFGYDDKGFLENAGYSAKYAFNPDNKQVLNVNLPKFPIYKEEFGDDKFCISGKDVDNLHDVISKAKAYMKGDTKTKQMKLVVDNT